MKNTDPPLWWHVNDEKKKCFSFFLKKKYFHTYYSCRPQILICCFNFFFFNTLKKKEKRRNNEYFIIRYALDFLSFFPLALSLLLNSLPKELSANFHWVKMTSSRFWLISFKMSLFRWFVRTKKNAKIQIPILNWTEVNQPKSLMTSF